MKKVLTKVITFVAVIAALVSYASAATWTQQQIKAHAIAEMARCIGLEENDPLIERARELWHEDQGKEQDIYILSRVIYNEAGNGCCEEHQLLVGRVVMNRVADERFPDSVFDVVTAPKQYLPAYAKGGSDYDVPADRLSYFEDLARRVLAGEPEDVPADVVFQDNERHGTGLYKSFLSGFGSTTYFCYG